MGLNECPKWSCPPLPLFEMNLTELSLEISCAFKVTTRPPAGDSETESRVTLRRACVQHVLPILLCHVVSSYNQPHIL